MGQVSRQDEKAAAMNEALAWVAASLSWERRLNDLVAAAPAAAFPDATARSAAPAAAKARRRPARPVVPAVEG